MMGLLQTVIIAVFIAMALWALGRWSGFTRRDLVAGFGDAVADGIIGLRAPGASLHGASKTQLGRSLAQSLQGEKTWFSQKLKVASGPYVVYAGPNDYLKLCGSIDEIIADLIDYLREAARAGKLTLDGGRDAQGRNRPFDLKVVQVLAREHIEDGRPRLVPYGSARAFELVAEQADGADWSVPRNALIEPHQLPSHADAGLVMHPVTGASFSGEPSHPRRAQAEGGPLRTDEQQEAEQPWAAAACTAIKTPTKAPVGMAYLEVVDLPDGTEPRATFMTMVDRAAYGRASSLGAASIPVARVSRHHFMLEWDGEWSIRDLDSAHGTFVNGNRVVHERLRDGDEIQLADVVCLAVHLPGRRDLDPPTDR